MTSQTTQRRLHLISVLLIVLLVTPASLVSFQGPASNSKPTGVLRLRVRVKIGEATRGLSRKRFYLVKGSLEQNKSVFDSAEQRPLISRDCYYEKLGASPEFIAWLKAGDCESVYCREIDEQFISGPKAVREFAVAYSAGEKELGSGNTGRKWLTNNLSPQLRDGFYKDRQTSLTQLIKQAETLSGAPVLSVMTDRNGTAYFTDLEPGTYFLTSFLPVEVGQMADSWNCEVQIKAGDIATERPYLLSNRKDKNVKCVAVEKPLPACNQ
jgi:hypothetical protein